MQTESPLTTVTPGAVQPDPQATPTALPVLTLWVPPDFDPASGTRAGDLLRQRLDEFSRQNGGVQVQVRVKAASGPGGLLESLNAAGAAAPLALPSLVALPRGDLEVAALKGLVFPLDGVSSAIDETDWYDYARQLAMVQGATFALPFAGDALVLAYRPGKVAVPPTDWSAVFRLSQPLAFPAGDPQALFVLSLYQSVDGQVEDAQRRPTLQPDRLSQVLQMLADGEQRGVFPYWLAQYETSGQVWQAYRDGRVNALITWVSNYLSSLPPDTAAVPVPRVNEASLSLSTGWGWAVADPIPERRTVSVKLAEFLTQGEFLAEWTEAAGYLPTRPSTLAAWSNQSLKTLLSPVAISAQARPTVDQLTSLGPVLKEATLKVLKRESDPTQAAKAASEKLAVPEAK
jgi:ABC-type glycerol-3-phosphate transport system substrate-binding protein